MGKSTTFREREKRRAKRQAALLDNLDKFDEDAGSRAPPEEPPAAPAPARKSKAVRVDAGDKVLPEASDAAYDADVADAVDGSEEEVEAAPKKDGFAAALGRVLQANIGDKKTPVLAKRRTKLMKDILADREEKRAKKAAAVARREKKASSLVVPDFSTADAERSFKKVATRGVVALFNAIAQYQHGADAENGGEVATGKAAPDAETAAPDAAKSRFMKLLKTGMTGGGASDKAKGTGDGGAGKPKWAALQKDYLMGAGMKDWDKDESDSDEDADDLDDAAARVQAAAGFADDDDAEADVESMQGGDDEDGMDGDEDDDVFGSAASVIQGDVEPELQSRGGGKRKRPRKRGSGASKKQKSRR